MLFLAYKDNTYQMIHYASVNLCQITVSLPFDRDGCKGHIYISFFPLKIHAKATRKRGRQISVPFPSLPEDDNTKFMNPPVPSELPTGQAALMYGSGKKSQCDDS